MHVVTAEALRCSTARIGRLGRRLVRLGTTVWPTPLAQAAGMAQRESNL
jgi:hypothetical protein